MTFCLILFCRNRILMVPRACNCNTIYLKIVLDSAEIFDFLHFRVCSASPCNNYRKVPKKAFLQCNFRLLIIGIENRQGSHLIGPKWTFNNKNFELPSNKKLVLRMLSHRENVCISKFWQKSKEKNLIYANKNSELSHTFKKIVE
jgi:hypothetical protein